LGGTLPFVFGILALLVGAFMVWQFLTSEFMFYKSGRGKDSDELWEGSNSWSRHYWWVREDKNKF